MKHIFCALLLFLFFASVAQPDYHGYNAFLKKHVDSKGRVDYRAIQRERNKLAGIVGTILQNPPDQKWKKEETMAFWINLYNASTILLIAEHYPILSITQLDGGKTWDVKRIMVGKKRYSLNEVENDMLRAPFKDPRIHFVLNCGARSCPPLLNEAIRPQILEQQLERQTRLFIRSDQMLISEKKVSISKIFDWYSTDFSSQTAHEKQKDKKVGVLNFLKKYSGVNIASDAEIEYLNYDWRLNN